MRTDWRHLQFVDRKKSGRNWYNTYTGFANEEEINEFDRYQQEYNYVYFPRITKRWEQDGKWFCELREADSCD